MKIVFGNQKGGVGKSTLCIMLTNYLTLVKDKEAVVLDMDFQKSIEERRLRDAGSFKGEMPYEVLAVDTGDYPQYAAQLNKIDDIVIIDLPGRLDDETLIPILKEADYVICPFDYEMSVFVSTMTFAKFDSASRGSSI